jgi:hypothetical protein
MLENDWQQISDLPGLVSVVNALWASRNALANIYMATGTG